VFESAGNASPIDAARSLLGSFVSALAMTTNVIWPGLRSFSPSFLGMILQWGGKIEETLTRLQCCIPASLRAISKEASRSLCFPTPLVKKIFVGIILIIDLIEYPA